MPRREWRDPAKERRWRRLLQQWQRSGMTGRDFCAKHSLSEPSFYAWKREIARRDDEVLERGKVSPSASNAATYGRFKYRQLPKVQVRTSFHHFVAPSSSCRRAPFLCC